MSSANAAASTQDRLTGAAADVQWLCRELRSSTGVYCRAVEEALAREQAAVERTQKAEGRVGELTKGSSCIGFERRCVLVERELLRGGQNVMAGG